MLCNASGERSYTISGSGAGRAHSLALNSLSKTYGSLGGVDKFKPVSGGGKMHHPKEAVGQLIVSGGDGAIDLEVAEHALDPVALLVERPIMLDFHATV